jgi:macrodomain Ter protein organizer (MatP/YcbG family)
MKATSRVVADVRPEVKQQLSEMAKAAGCTMTDILVQLIEENYPSKIRKEAVTQ